MSHLAFRPQSRTAMITAVVLFHAVLIYLFALSIGWIPNRPPTDFHPWTVLPPAAPSQPNKQPTIEHKPLTIPKTIDLPPVVIDGTGASGTAISDLVAPRLDPRHPVARPDYPAGAVRLGEEGSVLVSVLVAADGGVSDVRLERSSRYPLLDQAALDHARRNFRFLPATQAGMPIAAWHRITITFRLNEAQGN
jgi:protein TonB